MTIAPGKTEIAITQLSGGNQQKVVMSRWLRVAPKVLVLDEPTQGVDVGSKADVHRLVDLAVDNGAAVVVCSTDSDELARLSTRVMVMHRGLVVATLEGDEVTPDHIDERQLLADRRTAPETPTTERISHMTAATVSAPRRGIPAWVPTPTERERPLPAGAGVHHLRHLDPRRVLHPGNVQIGAR